MGSDREIILSSSGANCSMGIGYSSSSTARKSTTTNAQRGIVLYQGIMPPACAAPPSIGASIGPAQWQVNSPGEPLRAVVYLCAADNAAGPVWSHPRDVNGDFCTRHEDSCDPLIERGVTSS